MNLEIIYEDRDIAAVNKPPGVLFDWAIRSRPDFIIVHRLDKDTSGVMIVARNQKAFEFFKKLFHARLKINLRKRKACE